jgi:hypothetical protein
MLPLIVGALEDHSATGSPSDDTGSPAETSAETDREEEPVPDETDPSEPEAEAPPEQETEIVEAELVEESEHPGTDRIAN